MKVRELGTFIRGVTYKKDEASDRPFDGGVAILRAGNLRDDGIVLQDLVYVPERCASTEQRLRRGDIVVAMSSGSASVVGKTAVVIDDMPSASFGAFCGVIRPASTDTADWLRWYFRSPGYRAQATARAKGVNINNLRADDVLDLEIPWPDADERGCRIDHLDASFARTRRAKAALDDVPALVDRLRQSILAAAFRGDLTADWREENPDVEPASVLLERIRVERRRRWECGELPGGARGPYEDGRPSEQATLDEYPPSWCTATWGEVGFAQNGRAFPSSAYTTEGVPLLRPGNLHASGEVEWLPTNTQRLPNSWADQYPGHVVKGGEIVMNLTAQSLKDAFLGRVCMTGPSERCLLNQRIARLTPVLLEPRFAFWLLKAPAFRRFVDGLNTGSLIQHMFTSQLQNFAFALPPLAEQQEIARVLDRSMERLQPLAAMPAQQHQRLTDLELALLANAMH